MAFLMSCKDSPAGVPHDDRLVETVTVDEPATAALAEVVEG
jgi:hypothetical protein